jgi:hypothetical protein
MMTLELHYIGGEEAIKLEEVRSYTPMHGWLVVYFMDDSMCLFPTERIEQLDVLLLADET